MKLFVRLIAILGTLAVSSSAFALSLSPGGEILSGSIPNNPDAGDVECLLGGTSTYDTSLNPDAWVPDTCDTGALEELYKQDVGGPESGPYAPSYQTTFSNTSTDPQDALIDYLEGAIMDCSDECYLLVKDGNQDPVWYIFDISGWDGVEDINLTGFWPNQGAISHVSIFGGPVTTVPEPSTLALLGLGLFGMGIMRRRTS